MLSTHIMMLKIVGRYSKSRSIVASFDQDINQSSGKDIEIKNRDQNIEIIVVFWLRSLSTIETASLCLWHRMDTL